MSLKTMRNDTHKHAFGRDLNVRQKMTIHSMEALVSRLCALMGITNVTFGYDSPFGITRSLADFHVNIRAHHPVMGKDLGLSHHIPGDLFWDNKEFRASLIREIGRSLWDRLEATAFDTAVVEVKASDFI